MARTILQTRYDVTLDVVYQDSDLDTTFETPQYLISKNKYILRITLRNNATAIDYSNITTWTCYYGNLVITGDGELVTIPDGQINLVADWADVDISTGKICLQLDLNDAVALDVGTSKYKTHYLQIAGTDGTTQRTIAIIAYRTRGIVYDPQETLQYSSSSSSSSESSSSSSSGV